VTLLAAKSERLYGFGEETFAAADKGDRVAPIAAVRRTNGTDEAGPTVVIRRR